MNNRGGLTLDFLFAFILVMGFTSILFALSLTLTVAEITQYITFASARSYAGAHLTPQAQEQLALAKFQELVTEPEFNRLYTNGWFQISSQPVIGDVTNLFPEYKQSGEGAGAEQFTGVGVDFIARMLEFKIPFYGSTAAQGDGSGSGFSTFLASYLGREISTQECLAFMAERWKAIRKLSVPSGMTGYSTSTTDSGYVSYEDNGC